MLGRIRDDVHEKVVGMVERRLEISFRRHNMTERLSKDYFSLLNKYRVASSLRTNLIAFLGFILVQDHTSHPIDTLQAAYKLLNALRLCQISTLELVALLPQIVNSSPHEQLLALTKKLAEKAPPYLGSYVQSLSADLNKKKIDLDIYFKYLNQTQPPNIFEGINKESFTDLQTVTKWEQKAQSSIDPWIESHLGTIYASTLRSLNMGKLKPTNKLMIFLIMHLQLERFDPSANEALEYINDKTKRTVEITDLKVDIFKDPYVMARKFLTNLANYNTGDIAECALIVLDNVYNPFEKPAWLNIQTVTFKCTKFEIDFHRLFGIVTQSEFPLDVVYAKDRIFIEIVKSGRYRLDAVLQNSFLYFGNDDLDVLAMILERFRRRLPLPENILDSVMLVRSHVLAFQRYRKSYDTGTEFIVRGFADVSQNLGYFYGDDQMKRVAKYLTQFLFWLPVNWNDEFRFLPRLRIPRQTAALMLQVLIHKKLIPDTRDETTVRLFLESKFSQIDWAHIGNASKVWVRGVAKPPKLPNKFEISLNFTNDKFKDLNTATKAVSVKMVDTRLEISTTNICVNALRFKVTNTHIVDNIKELLYELPDLNNPTMFWRVKTFFTFNYKYIFDTEFNVCQFKSYKLLLKGAILKALSLKSVIQDQDLREIFLAYSTAFDSKKSQVEVGPTIYFLSQLELKPLLPQYVTNIPVDVDSIRLLVKQMYISALDTRFNINNAEVFTRLEIEFKQLNPNYDFSDFDFAQIEAMNRNPNEIHLRVMKSILEPTQLLRLLGPDFDKSTAKTPQDLLRLIIINIMKHNKGALTNQNFLALQYYLNVVDTPPTIISLKNIPQISKSDTFLVVLEDILRWDHLRPFLQADFKFPENEKQLNQLIYIIDYLLKDKTGTMSKAWVEALQHFQEIFKKMDPPPVIDVRAVPGLTGTIAQFIILNKVLQVNNLVKFLPQNFVFQGASTPKTQLKNIVDGLLFYSETKLKLPTVKCLKHFQAQLSLSITELVIDIEKIVDITVDRDELMLMELRELLRKDRIFIYLPPDFTFNSNLTPREQLLLLLRTILTYSPPALNPRKIEMINYFTLILDFSMNSKITVVRTEEIVEICASDSFLPTLDEMLMPDVLWKYVGPEYKEKPNASPKEKLKEIIKFILKTSGATLSKKQFDAINHFEDILDYADACQNLPPIVNLTLVPQIIPTDSYISVLEDILRIDILIKLVSPGFYFPVDVEQQYLLKLIVVDILKSSSYKLKPKWLNVLLTVKMILATEVNIITCVPELKGDKNLNVIVDILRQDNVTIDINLEQTRYNFSRTHIIDTINVIREKIKLVNPKKVRNIDELIKKIKPKNSTGYIALDIDKITGVYVTNPKYATLYKFLQEPKLVKTVAPHFTQYGSFSPTDQLIFLTRDALRANSTYLTREVKDTLIYFYDLTTATIPKITMNVYRPNEVEDALNSITTIRNDALLPSLRLILFNPNIPPITKLSTVECGDQPSKIIYYIINCIAIKFPDLEIDIYTKKVLDHFRAVLSQPIPSVTSVAFATPAKITMTKFLPQNNVSAFITEISITLQTLVKPEESKLITSILTDIINIFDLLEIPPTTLYKGTPEEQTVMISKAIESKIELIKTICPDKPVDKLVGIFSRVSKSSTIIKDKPAPSITLIKHKIPNSMQEEINNVIGVFMAVPDKEVLSLAMKIENITSIINLDVEKMTLYSPDEKLYHLVTKIHKNVDAISGYFPGKDVEKIVEMVISTLNPSYQLITGSKAASITGKFIPNVDEVALTLSKYFPGPDGEQIIEFIKHNDTAELLGLDEIVMLTNTPQQNLIYILDTMKGLGDKLINYFPNKDIQIVIGKMLSNELVTLIKPGSPIGFRVSIFKQDIMQAIKFIKHREDIEEKETLISMLELPGLSSILKLDASVISGYTPEKKARYILEKAKENNATIAKFFPGVEKIIGTFFEREKSIEMIIPAEIVGKVTETISMYFKNHPNKEIMIKIANSTEIQKVISLDIPSMTMMTPLENMISVFQGVKEHIGELTKYFTKEELDQIVAVVLREDVKPIILISAVEAQIETYFKGLPEKDLLIQIVKAVEADTKIAMMKYNSPLENMIYIFQEAKNNIKKITGILQGKDLAKIIGVVLKEDSANLTTMIVPIRNQIETMYIAENTKSLLIKILNSADALNISITLMKYCSPIENLVYVFQKIRDNITLLQQYPGEDAYGAVTAIFSEEEKKIVVLIPEVQRQVEYYFSHHPEKELLLKITKIPDIEAIIHLNYHVMSYYSPRENMIYFYKKVQDEIKQISLMFPEKHVIELVRSVLGEDNDRTFTEILIPVKKVIEVYFSKNKYKETLIQILNIPQIEEVIYFNIPCMRYNSPLENMIYYFARLKNDLILVTSIVTDIEIDIDIVLDIVFPSEMIKPSVLIFGISQLVEEYFVGHPDYPAIIEVVSVPDIVRAINLNLALLYYQSPLEAMIYFFQTVKDNMDKLTAMFPGRRFEEIVSLVLREEAKSTEAILCAVRKKIEILYGKHPDKSILIKITEITNILAQIGVNIPLLKYLSPTENMLIIFKKVYEEIKKVTLLMPNENIANALKLCLKEEQKLTISLFSPIVTVIEFIFKNHPDKEVMIAITKIPNVEAILHIDTLYVQYLSPLEKMIYFFKKVKENIDAITALVNYDNVPGVVAIIVKETGISTEEILKVIRGQIILYYGDHPYKEVMIQITNIPGILQKIHVIIPLMIHYSPFECMIYFFQLIYEDVSVITASEMVSVTDVVTVVESILMPKVEVQIEFVNIVINEIQVNYGTCDTEKVLTKIISIEDVISEVYLNIPLTRYYSPLENMIYFFQCVEINKAKISTYLPENEIDQALAIVLKRNENVTYSFTKTILRKIMSYYGTHSNKEQFLLVMQIPDIEKIIFCNTVLMKYNSPLENMIYFFQKVKDNIDKVSVFLPGQNLRQLVSIILKEETKGFEVVIPLVIEQIKEIYAKHPDVQSMITVASLPEIEKIIHLRLPMMLYQSPLENLIYMFRKVEENILGVKTQLPTLDIKKVITIIVKSDVLSVGQTRKPTQLAEEIIEQIIVRLEKVPELEIMKQIAQAPDIMKHIGIDLALMRYYTPLEKMVVFFQAVKDNLEIVNAVVPNVDVERITQIVLKENDVRASTILATIVRLIKKYFDNHPAKRELIQMIMIPDIQFIAKLNIAVMSYNSPLENMVYFFERVEDCIFSVSKYIPEENIRKALVVVLKKDQSPFSYITKPIIERINILFSKHSARETLIKILKHENIDTILMLCVAYMKYNQPIANMIEIFETVSTNLPLISGLFPGEDVSSILNAVLKQDSKGFKVLIPPMTNLIRKIIADKNKAEVLIDILNLPDIEITTGVCLALMKYYQPLDNLLYFFEKVKDVFSVVSKLLPGKDVQTIVTTFIQPERLSLISLAKPIKEYISYYYPNYKEKELLIRIIVNTIEVENILNLNLEYMFYSSPLENLVYFFQTVGDNIGKVSALFPGQNVQEAVSTVLQKNVKFITIIKSVEKVIESLFRENVENITMKQIVNIPDIEIQLNLNVPLMTYMSPLENALYIFQRAKDYIAKVSSIFPEKGVDSAIEIVLSSRTLSRDIIFTSILQQIEKYFSKHPSKELLVQMANIPDIEFVIHLDMNVMSYNSPLENLIYLFKLIKYNANKIIAYYSANDIEKVAIAVLKDVANTREKVATIFFSPIITEMKVIFPDKQDELGMITKILDTVDIDIILGLNLPLMEYYSPMENMVYIIEKVKENYERVAVIFPDLNVQKLVTTVLKEDEASITTISKGLLDLIATFYNKLPDKEVLSQILMKPGVELIIHIDISLMRYKNVTENAIYFFKNVKDNIQIFEAYFPSMDVSYIISNFLQAAFKNFNVSLVTAGSEELPFEITLQIKEKIEVYFRYKPEKDIMMKILDAKAIFSVINLNISILTISSPLENMLYVFRKVEENTGKLSAILPVADINKAVSIVLREIRNEDKMVTIFRPIVDTVQRVYGKSPATDLMILIVQSPNLTQSLHLNLPLMRYQTPIENLMYIFKLIRDNIAEMSTIFTAKELGEVVALVTKGKRNSTLGYEINQNTIISMIIQQITKHNKRPSEVEVMIKIAKIPRITQIINLDVPLLSFTSPLENMIKFFQTVKDNIQKLTMYVPREDIERAVSIVLMEDIRAINFVNDVLSGTQERDNTNYFIIQIKQKIQEYYHSKPEEKILMSIADIKDISFILNLNDILMFYQSPLENFIYFFQKVREENLEVSLYLGGLDVSKIVLKVLRQAENIISNVSGKGENGATIILGPLSIVVDTIEKYYHDHKDKIQMIRIVTHYNIAKVIHLDIALMTYMTPLEKMVYFFEKVEDSIQTITMLMPELEAQKVIQIILRDDVTNTGHISRAHFTSFIPPIVQQIERYFRNHPKKEIIIQLIKIPGIAYKLGLSLPLMSYNSPIENLVYFFQKVKEKIHILTLFLSGSDVSEVADIVLWETSKSSSIDVSTIIGKIREWIIRQTSNKEEQSLLIKITEMPDICAIIHISKSLMAYQSPLENYVYFFQKLEENKKEITVFLTPEEVRKAIELVIFRNENVKNYQQPIYVIFPIEQQIAKILNSLSPEYKLAIKILKIPKIESALFLSIPLMTYQTPFENMIYIFQKVLDNIESVSTFLPAADVSKVEAMILKGKEYNSSVVLSPVVSQISIYFIKPADRNLLTKLANVPEIINLIHLDTTLMKYQRPLENMIYFIQNLKNEIEKVSALSFAPDNELKAVISKALKEEAELSWYLFSPVVNMIKYYLGRSPYEDILVQITKIPDIITILSINIPLVKYQSPLENMIYFFTRVKDDIKKITTIYSWSDINEAITAVLRDVNSFSEEVIYPLESLIAKLYPSPSVNQLLIQIIKIPRLEMILNLSLHLLAHYSPIEKLVYIFETAKKEIEKISVVYTRSEVERAIEYVIIGREELKQSDVWQTVSKEIEIYYGKVGTVESIFSKVLQIPGFEAIIDINVHLLHYLQPLEKLIYVFQKLKENINLVSSVLQDTNLEKTIGIVLKENKKILFIEQITHVINLYYRDSVLKEIMLEIVNTPNIQHVVYINVPLTKYYTPLENFIYFFQKINEDITKISRLLPGRDIIKIVTAGLRNYENKTLSIYLPIIRKIEQYSLEFQESAKLMVQILKTLNIDSVLGLNIPLMTYNSPLENMVYFVEMLKKNQGKKLEIFQSMDLSTIITRVMKEEGKPSSFYLKQIEEQIEIYHVKHPDKQTMIDMLKINDSDRLLGLNVALMRYYTPLENMIYFFEKVNQNIDEMLVVLPGRDIHQIVDVIIKEEEHSLACLLSAVKEQVEAKFSHRPNEKDMMIRALQVTDLEFLINLNVPLMRYNTPLENFVYVAEKFNDNIDKMSTIFPIHYTREVVSVALRENEGTINFLVSIQNQMQTYVRNQETQQLLIGILKYPGIERIIRANLPLMRYYRPVEKWVYFCQKVKDERDSIAELFPGKNISSALEIVLREEGATIETLIIPIVQQMSYFLDQHNEKEMIIAVLQMQELLHMLVINVNLMQYQSPLENMIYLIQAMKYNVEVLVKRLPFLDIKRIVQIVLKEDESYTTRKPREVLPPIIFQVKKFITNSSEAAVILKVLDLFNVIDILDLNILLMTYYSPLENLIYFLSAVNDNIPKLSSFIPNEDIGRITATILNQDKKQFETILKTIREQIEKLFSHHTLKEVIIKIIQIPSIDLVIFLNLPLMALISDLEKTLYFFQSVKNNIEKVSVYIPKEDVIKVVELVLREEGPSFDSLISNFHKHIDKFYAKQPGHNSIVEIVNTPNIMIDMNINVAWMRYNSELVNLIYFYNKVLEKNIYFSGLFPDNDAETVLKKFLEQAEMYIQNFNSSGISLVEINEITEQIKKYFGVNPNNSIALIAIAKLPNVIQILNLDTLSIKGKSPLDKCIYFLKQVVANFDKIRGMFPDIISEGHPNVQDINAFIQSDHSTPPITMVTETPTKKLTSQELIKKTIAAYVSENDKEWVFAAIDLKDIVNILGLDVTYMRSLIPIESVKYCIQKAKENVNRLAVYFPGKDMLPVITTVLANIEKNKTASQQVSPPTPKPDTAKTITPRSPLYASLPPYLEAMVVAIPSGVSITSIRMFATLLQTQNFVENLNIQQSVLMSYTPRHLLEVMIDLLLKNQEIMSDYIIRSALQEIAKSLGMFSGGSTATIFNATSITVLIPRELDEAERKVIIAFLERPDLFKVANVNEDVNSFLFHYPTPNKQLMTILYRTASSQDLPEDLIMIVLKVLSLLSQIKKQTPQEGNTIMEIVLNLPETVMLNDINLVVSFLKTPNLLQQIGFTTTRANYSSDNDFAYEVLYICQTIPSVMQNKPLHQAVIRIITGLEQAKCKMSTHGCRAPKLTFEKIVDILGLNDTSGEILMEILHDCKATETYKDDASLVLMKKLFGDVFKSSVVQNNTKYLEIVKQIMVRLGIETNEGKKIDIVGLIAFIPKETLNYIKLVQFFKVVDIEQLLGSSIVLTNYNSASKIMLIDIVEMLLEKVISKDYGVIYDALVDLLRRLKGDTLSEYTILIAELLVYLPNINDRGVIISFLDKNDVLQLLGQRFDINLYADAKSKLLNLLKVLLLLQEVKGDILLEVAIQKSITMMESAQQGPTAEITRNYNFEKLLELLDRSLNPEFYDRLGEFLRRTNLRVLLGVEFVVEEFKTANGMLRAILEIALKRNLCNQDVILKQAITFYLIRVKLITVDVAITEEYYTLKTIETTLTVDLDEAFNALDYGIAAEREDEEGLKAIQAVFTFLGPDSQLFSPKTHLKGFDVMKYKNSAGLFVQSFFKHLGTLSDELVPPNIKKALLLAYPYIQLTGAGAVPVQTQETSQISTEESSSTDVSASVTQKELTGVAQQTSQLAYFV